jgi:hypothetical protein
MSATTTPSLQQEAANLVSAVATLLQLLAANESDATLQTSINSAVATIVTATNQVVLSSNLPGTLPIDLPT